jgi:glycerophosphoryl diester phosphodiesterase
MHVIGHRGHSGRCPENTAPALAEALAAGADMIEIDARLTADGRVAVVHDGDLGRYGHPGLRVAGLTLAELLRLDAGRWFDPHFAGTPFLALEGALAAVAGRVPLNIELKVDPGEERQVPALASAVEAALRGGGAARGAPRPPVLLSSFALAALQAIRELDAEIPLGLLLGADADLRAALAAAAPLAIEGVHLHVEHATPAAAELVRGRGLRLRVYTVNDEDGWRRLAALGVDGIFTDWPDRLRAFLARVAPA